MMQESPSSTAPNTAARPDIVSDAFLVTLRQHGVRRAFLFGSFARNEESDTSDLDLLVEFVAPVSLFDELRLAEKLEAICGYPVDLATDIHPAFAPYIEPTLVRLPV